MELENNVWIILCVQKPNLSERNEKTKQNKYYSYFRSDRSDLCENHTLATITLFTVDV